MGFLDGYHIINTGKSGNRRYALVHWQHPRRYLLRAKNVQGILDAIVANPAPYVPVAEVA
jgi:hypothetical protein